MSDDLYLIAHKVRGEPAFDIAQHLTCPKCNATDDHCTACNGVGHWWVIPTSGHRAWPYQSWPLEDLYWAPTISDPKIPITYATESIMAKDMDVRDHYAVEQEIAINLMHALGLNKPPAPSTPILRRF